ncbi:hypothetical protein FJ251_13525 [bacterium]|nr:hypothetical protein [bacterium]
MYPPARPLALRLASLLAALLTALPAQAALIHAPGSAGSIRGALALAQPGDLVLIAPGRHAEGVSLEVSVGITLRGGGARPEDTELSGAYMHQILSVAGDGAVTIENLSLRDGFGVRGGGLSVAGAQLTLRDLRFLRNAAAADGGAIYAVQAGLDLENCLFYANYASSGSGAALHIAGASPGGQPQRIAHCTFAANAGCCGGRSLVLADCAADISNCILEDVVCGAGVTARFACNNGSTCGQSGDGNFIADPRYCGFELADCRLEPDSPCLPENNPDCGLIGAYGGCATTAAASTSFSAVKSLYR